MKKIVAVFVCLLFLASGLGISAVVIAAPPDKCEPWPECKGGGEEPDPTGTIFFKYNDGEGLAIWTMNADGSGKAKQVIETCTDFDWYKGIAPEEEFGIPSRVKHGDHHWYLRFCGIYDLEGNATTYPDGMGRREIFAVKDDNSVTVQLTFDATLASRKLTAPLPIWGIGDNSISWGAKRWIEGEQYPTDFGIYGADLEWAENGDLVGLSGAISRICDTGYWYNENKDRYLPDIKSSHDWAPDETKIVYTNFTGQMYVVDLSIPQESYLAPGWHPQWSPAGSKISFKSVSLRTINPDGTGEQILVEPRGGRSWSETIHDPGFSPDGNFLVYQIHGVTFKTEPPGHYFHIYTIGVDGSGKSCLTKDLTKASYKTSHAWR